MDDAIYQVIRKFTTGRTVHKVGDIYYPTDQEDADTRIKLGQIVLLSGGDD